MLSGKRCASLKAGITIEISGALIPRSVISHIPDRRATPSSPTARALRYPPCTSSLQPPTATGDLIAAMRGSTCSADALGAQTIPQKQNACAAREQQHAQRPISPFGLARLAWSSHGGIWFPG